MSQNLKWFSNDMAFLVHRMAVEAGDKFTGLVSVAGKMPETMWAKKNRRFAQTSSRLTERSTIGPLWRSFFRKKENIKFSSCNFEWLVI
jgi:hypothetical protein